MYILYGGNYTRARMVEMVMAEGGIDYELRNIDIGRNEHLSPGFLEINPAGRVPVLVTPEGEILYETPAINLYLAEHHGLSELAPAIGDPDRGRFLSGLFYISNELEPALKRFWYSHRYGAGEKDAPAVKARAYEEGIECLNLIDRRLADAGPFYLGERFSLVDLMTAYWAVCFEPGSISGLKNIECCVDRVTSRPRLAALFEMHKGLNKECYTVSDATPDPE